MLNHPSPQSLGKTTYIKCNIFNHEYEWMKRWNIGVECVTGLLLKARLRHLAVALKSSSSTFSRVNSWVKYQFKSILLSHPNAFYIWTNFITHYSQACWFFHVVMITVTSDINELLSPLPYINKFATPTGLQRFSRNNFYPMLHLCNWSPWQHRVFRSFSGFSVACHVTALAPPTSSFFHANFGDAFEDKQERWSGVCPAEGNQRSQDGEKRSLSL